MTFASEPNAEPQDWNEISANGCTSFKGDFPCQTLTKRSGKP
jgi:hypothetical protein